MTRLVYLGAEVGSNRLILEAAGVGAVGVSFWRLVKRGLPKTKKYLLTEHFREGLYIHVYPGIPKDAELSAEEFKTFAIQYRGFVLDNIERLSMVSEIDHAGYPKDKRQYDRDTFWKTSVPVEKLLVTWASSDGMPELELLSGRYRNVGIYGEDIDTNVVLAAATQRLVHRHGVAFHAIACAKPDNLRQVKVETASTLSWLSPMMHGETIVWDGNRIVRYPKSMKEQARPRYHHIYAKAGLDTDKILADDDKEVSRLALWSYMQLERRINMQNTPFLSDNNDEVTTAEMTETALDTVDNKGGSMRKVETRDPEEMRALPVFGYDTQLVTEVDADGQATSQEVLVVRSQNSSLRVCNTCFLSSNCPAFKPNNSCAYSLPIEVKTKEQLNGLINAVIEMQGQRIAFGRFAEELNGGYPDKNLSDEIERLFKILKTVNDLGDSSSLKVSIESRSTAGGILQHLFGPKAAVLSPTRAENLNEIEAANVIESFTS